MENNIYTVEEMTVIKDKILSKVSNNSIFTSRLYSLLTSIITHNETLHKFSNNIPNLYKNIQVEVGRIQKEEYFDNISMKNKDIQDILDMSVNESSKDRDINNSFNFTYTILPIMKTEGRYDNFKGLMKICEYTILGKHTQDTEMSILNNRILKVIKSYEPEISNIDCSILKLYMDNTIDFNRIIKITKMECNI